MNAQIVLENVGVRLPNRTLFENVNWTLYEGMRVALAGRNGSGKSTLLKIMAGTTETSEGRCNIVGGRRVRIGFLDQSLLDKAVIETATLRDSSLSPVGYIKGRLIPQRDEEESEESVEWETRKILAGLGFSKEQMDDPMNKLSGGWLLRMFIGATLLEKPDVLLLDEPTNHLDISSIQWLEEFLEKEYKGSLILVTHDVALQKRATDSLAILHGGRFYFRSHQRDYFTFRDSLAEEGRLVEKAIESLQKKIDENMEFVYKFRAKAQTAARASSKLKSAEDLTEEQNRLKDRLNQIRGFAYGLQFSFRLGDAGAKFPISTKSLYFKYKPEAEWITQNVQVDFKRGQKVAILGDNGTGKTTLLNLLAGRLKPTQGEVSNGHGVDIGYFGQHQLDELSLEDTVVDNLRTKAKGVGLEQLRGWLGAFGFSGNDDIAKKVKVLSGGERARLALLRILVTPINVVLLDEPTNHLDVETKELLKSAIKSFPGTIIFVSHDRDFVEAVAERVLYLSTDHRLTDHIGDLDSFFAKYPEFVRHIEGVSKVKAAPLAAKSTEQTGPTLSYEERKKLRNQIKSLEKKIAAAEQSMEQLGTEKDALGPSDAHRLASIDKQLHTIMIDWEKWTNELEAARKLKPD